MTHLRFLLPRSAFALSTLGLFAACASNPTDDDVDVAPSFGETSLSRHYSGRRLRPRKPSPTPSEPAPSPPPSSPAPTGKLPFRGVNLSGAEFGSRYPGTEPTDYTWPRNDEVDYFMSKGMNTFRINFAWERLQPNAKGELAAAYTAKLDALVAHATSKGAAVLLNPQNFARYYGSTVGSAACPSAVFADLWRRLALRFQDNPRVFFGLVNEPHDIATEQWVLAANDALQAIRATGATNTVFVPGNAWTGAHSWNDDWYGTSNAVGMLKVVDPGNNIVFEAHQYLDESSGGETGNCVSSTIGRERLTPFVDWLRKNGKKGFIAEFAGGNNAKCNTAIADMLDAMEEASDVLNGWTWWAAGPDWQDYRFSIEPKNGADAPQMGLLTPRLIGLPTF